jgi:release factor glutamine methyltransferase
MDWQKRQKPVVWKLMAGTPVGRALVAATQRLEEARCDTASLDAQVILAHIMDKERGWLFAHYDQALTQEEADSFAELVARRAAAEPVAYLVGHREFYGLDLIVDDRVLIPRPETELLVDAVLDHIDSRTNQNVRMVDVGTGSGAVAVAVAANCPSVQIYAADLSLSALEVAKQNVARHDSRGQITLLQSDLLDALPKPVDIIAANLPYITSGDYLNLMADVRDYEPRLALEAGPEGLDLIERLLDQAPGHLYPGGVLFLEIGASQGTGVLQLVERMLPQAQHIGLRQDYHGYDRLVVIGL